MQPFSLLIKPAGPDCNMACRYCFYSGKTGIFGAGTHRMGDEVLEKLISGYMGLRLPVSSFAWQGGEPTLMGLDFFRKVVALQKKHGKSGQVVTNALQTNGLLLNDQWCEFLDEYRFLVGISLDGPREYHDCYRVDHSGAGTFEKVMAAIRKCRRHEVEFNVLVLLNDRNASAPDELFNFFAAEGIRFLQFVPCVEKDAATGMIAGFSVTPEQYGEFLCRIFDRWIKHGPEKLSIRMFDSILGYLIQGRHTVCTFGRACDDYVVVEHNGDAFCCDFFVSGEYRLGNVLESPIDRLVRDEAKRRFARRKGEVGDKCLVCRYGDICRGGCLKDRIALHDGFSNPSYFCEAYKRFFGYALDRLTQIAAKVAGNRAREIIGCE